MSIRAEFHGGPLDGDRMELSDLPVVGLSRPPEVYKVVRHSPPRRHSVYLFFRYLGGVAQYRWGGEEVVE